MTRGGAHVGAGGNGARGARSNSPAKQRVGVVRSLNCRWRGSSVNITKNTFVVGGTKMRNIAPRAGIEPTSLEIRASMLTI